MCKIAANMDSGRKPPLRRILAIDDDPVSLAVATVLLEAEGCTVLQASGGEQALALLDNSPQAEPPDCVIADLRMPSLAGPELAARLRVHAPHAFLFAMSATPPPHVEGYDAVLKKPLAPEALRAAIARVDQPPQSRGSESSSSPGASEDLDTAIFDRLQSSMSAAGLGEVVSAFFQDTRARLALMRSADPATVQREAHTVKGGAGMVGAIRVSTTASAVEAGIDNSGDRMRKLDELEVALRRVEVILKERLKI